MSLSQIAFVGLLTLVSLVVMAIVPYLLEIAPDLWAQGRAHARARAAWRGANRGSDPPNPPERPNAGSPRSNAAERGSGGSRTFAEPPEPADSEPEPEIDRGMVRAIARHKLTNPSDGKAVTILTVFGARKGSSQAYQLASAAWDWLYADTPAPNPAHTPIAGRPYDPRRYASSAPADAE